MLKRIVNERGPYIFSILT